ncbi:MAG TPA: DUF1543 domain-containing protein [Acidimicrobiales bacterium]
MSAEAQLYAVYLGGDPAPGRLTEDHEVVLVVALDVTDARRRARAKWGASTRPHVDGVMVVDVVDGFAITLTPTTRPESVDVDLTFEPEGAAHADEMSG